MLDVLEKSLTFFLNLSLTIVVKNNDIFSHLIPNYFELIRRLCYFLRPFYPRGKEPTQELYSSSRRTAVVPLFKNFMQFFWLFFWAGQCCLTLKQRARIMVGLERTSDFSIERRRRNHFTTAPPKF